MTTDHRAAAVQAAVQAIARTATATLDDAAEAVVAAAEPHLRALVAEAIRAEADAAEGETDWGTSYWTQALHRAARIAEGTP